MTRSPRRRTWRAWPALLAALAGFALLVAGATPATAHAQLIESNPADGVVVDDAPDQLTLTFNEPVQARADAVQVIDPAGERLEVTAGSRDAIVTADLPAPASASTGTYVVSWRVTSQDGHPVAGGFAFSVEAPSAPAADVRGGGSGAHGLLDNAVRVTQGLTYLGLLVAAGLVVFGTVAPRGVIVVVRRRLRWVSGFACVLAVAGSVLLLPLSAVQRDGGERADVVTGRAWTDQLTAPPGAAAGVVAVGLLTAWLATGAPGASRIADTVALGAAGLALSSVVLVGHTRTFGPAWLVVPTDVLHVATAACWLGGLVALALMLAPPARGRTLSADDAAVALARFSTLAAGLVAALTAAGVVLGWRVLGSWSAMFGTSYGVTLLVKVGLVLVVVAVAGVNRYRMLPRVQARIGSGSAWAALRRAVRVEAALLVAVVAATGVLVSQNPIEDGETTSSAPATETTPSARAELGDATVTAELNPGATGPNMVVLTLTDAEGQPLDPLEAPQVSVTLPAEEVGPLSRSTTSTGVGRYEARVDLPLPGVWEIEVSVRVAEFENPIATIPLEIR